ncbi:unnamed protein product [Leptosia nina]|uniref:Uncharacterized protein n=1 Tax=Leptosia nina TaxID=320188 RepID=A0AAV1JFU0_9NEOP
MENYTKKITHRRGHRLQLSCVCGGVERLGPQLFASRQLAQRRKTHITQSSTYHRSPFQFTPSKYTKSQHTSATALRAICGDGHGG